ncbi:MAG TPA: DUF3180 domain-containing protein [Dermatophilaceae bacterium]|nr:DUF3180 domain-containing protein [Dermatophilaceae bacterium]
MVKDGRGVSIRLLLLLGLAATALCYLGLRIWTGQGHDLPVASWGALVVLLFLSCGVYFAGLPVRRFLRGQATKSLNPLRAMRTLVLAQATALTGALVTGWYLAQVLVLLPVFDVPSRRAAMVRLAALAAGGVLMSVAGLAAQAMCRVDGDPRDHDREQDRDFSRDDEDDPSREH